MGEKTPIFGCFLGLNLGSFDLLMQPFDVIRIQEAMAAQVLVICRPAGSLSNSDKTGTARYLAELLIGRTRLAKLGLH